MEGQVHVQSETTTQLSAVRWIQREREREREKKRNPSKLNM